MKDSNGLSIAALAISLLSGAVAVTAFLVHQTHSLKSLIDKVGDPNDQSGLYGEVAKANTNAATALRRAVPVGTILAWIALGEETKTPPGWEICDGLNGKPNLKEKFLSGVVSVAATGEYGGNNEITEDGDHNHGENRTSKAPFDGAGGGNPNNNKEIMHNHKIPGSGIHSHGGDNRPAFFTVLYIIKLKEIGKLPQEVTPEDR